MEPVPGYNQGDGGAKIVRAYEYEYDRRKRPATALTRVSENRDACPIGGRVGWVGSGGWGGGGDRGRTSRLTWEAEGQWGPGMAALGVHGVRRPCPAAELRRAAGAWPSGVRVEAPGQLAPSRPGYVSKPRGTCGIAGRSLRSSGVRGRGQRGGPWQSAARPIAGRIRAKGGPCLRV